MNTILKILLIMMLSVVTNAQNTNLSFVSSADTLQMHLEFLGSDSLEGRGTGTRGGDMAAVYLAEKFSEYNISAFDKYPDYFQNIPMHGVKVKESTTLELVTKDSAYVLNSGEDFVLYKTNKQLFGTQRSDLVFAGYGINAPEYDYNDYFSIDVTGKVVVVFSGEPYSEGMDFFKAKYPTIHYYSESKFRTAIAHGAEGIIIIDNQSFQMQAWNNISNDFSFEDVTLAYNPTSVLSVRLNENWNPVLFENSGKSPEEIYNSHFTNTIRSFPLNTKLRFTGKVKKRDFISPNVIGYIEGSDESHKDEFIIISAHYDHLGIGPAVKGDSIYNGVLDNAIGCSSLLELVRLLSENRTLLKRSVMFLLTTGEEKGLLGATYYTDHPVIPLYKTVANLNIDGIAFLDEFKTIVGIGAEYSELGEILNSSAVESGVKLTTIPDYFNSWESFNRSDQIAFAKVGIPAILIMEGVDPVNKNKQEIIDSFIHYISNIYHTPSDDLNININYKAVAQHTNILTRFVFNLSVADESPEWYKSSPYYILRLQSKAEKR